MGDAASPDLLASPISPQSMPQPIVHAFPSRLTATNTYIVVDPVTEEAAIINPVLDLDPLTNEIRTRSADQLLKFVNDEGLTVRWILETALHRDRISACRYLQLMLKHIGDGVVPKVCVGGNSFCTCGDDDDIAEGEADAATRASNPPVPATQLQKDPGAFDHLFDDGEHIRIGNMLAQCTHLDDHAGVTYVVGPLVFASSGLARNDDRDPTAGVLQHPEPPPDKASPAQVSSRQKPSIDEVLGSAEQLSLEASGSDPSTEQQQQQSAPPPPTPPPQASPLLAFYAEQVNTRGGRIPRKINMPAAQRNASMSLSANADADANNENTPSPPPVDNGKGKGRERRASSMGAPMPLRIPRKLGVIMC